MPRVLPSGAVDVHVQGINGVRAFGAFSANKLQSASRLHLCPARAMDEQSSISLAEQGYKGCVEARTHAQVLDVIIARFSEAKRYSERAISKFEGAPTPTTGGLPVVEIAGGVVFHMALDHHTGKHRVFEFDQQCDVCKERFFGFLDAHLGFDKICPGCVRAAFALMDRGVMEPEICARQRKRQAALVDAFRKGLPPPSDE